MRKVPPLYYPDAEDPTKYCNFDKNKDQPGSVPSAEFYNAVNAEIVNAITAAGLEPSAEKNNQLAEAIGQTVKVEYDRLIDIMDSKDAQNVKLTGDQVINGKKTLRCGTGDQRYLPIQNEGMSNSKPTANKYCGIAFIGDTSQWTGCVRSYKGSDGGSTLQSIAYSLDGSKQSQLYHGFNVSGNWIGNVVVTDNNREQDISGTKRFLNSIRYKGNDNPALIGYDSDNKKVGDLFINHSSNGNNYSILRLYKTDGSSLAGQIGLISDGAGGYKSECTITPAVSANDSQIATCYWVKNLLNTSFSSYGPPNISSPQNISKDSEITISSRGWLYLAGKCAYGQDLTVKATIGSNVFEKYLQIYQLGSVTGGNGLWAPVEKGAKVICAGSGSLENFTFYPSL